MPQDENDLRPDEEPKPNVESDYVKQAFGAEGVFASTFDGYKVRRGQLELAYAVASTMRDGGSLLAEAPTGTGKSVAALVPAVVATQYHQKTVVATANIALQEQYVETDLPRLQKILPWNFTFAIAKGINNYLCKARLEEAADEVLLNGMPVGVDKAEWKTIQDWATKTVKGDVSELPFEAKRSLPMFTTTSDDCIGKKCDHFATCPAMAARYEMRKADIVVTNYHLFFADLMLKVGHSEGVLPRYDHLIFDEAHKVADIARDFVGFRVSRGSLRWAVRLLNAPKKGGPKGDFPVIDEELHQRVTMIIDEFFLDMKQLFESDDYEIRFKRKGQVRTEPLRVELTNAANAFHFAKSEHTLTPERTTELERAQLKIDTIIGQLLAFEEMTDATRWVYYLEAAGNGVALKAKPIEVATFLEEHLFGRAGEEPEGNITNESDEDAALVWAPHSIIAMSATLTTGPGKFDYIQGELGANDAECIEVDSPFDYRKQCLFVSPPITDTSSRGWLDEVVKNFEEVIEVTGGGVLGLFTSNRARDHVAKELRFRQQFGHLEQTLLVQGDAPRLQLIRQFKADVDSILLGTESFWAGVDVPGDACRAVVIDKLPFPSVGDPLEDMLKAANRDYFKRFSMPKAILQFKQGFGRAVRSESDRAVVVLLDRRTVDKPYGSSFIKALPTGLPLKRSLSAIEEMF